MTPWKVSPKASEHKVNYGVWKSSRTRLRLPHFGCWSDVLCSVKSNPSSCSQACACVCVWRRGKSKLFMGPQLVISLRKFGKMNTGTVLSPPLLSFLNSDFYKSQSWCERVYLVSRLLSVCTLWAIVWKACPSGLLMHVTLSCIFKCQQNM